MALRPIEAYGGDAPFVFVSYAHADSERVYAELAWLANQGVKLWYDDGIEPGSRWSDALADALDRAAHVVFYVTPTSVASRNCLDEIGFALERDKPLLAVHLEHTPLPAGLALRLGSRQAVMQHDVGSDAGRSKVLATLSHLLGNSEAASTPARTPAPLGREQVQVQVLERLCSAVAVLAIEARDDSLAELAEICGESIEDALAPPWGRLVGTAATERLRARGLTPAEIAREVGVGVVVSGNLRRRSDGVRLSIELHDADGNRFGSRRFDEPLTPAIDADDEFMNPINWVLRRLITQYQGERVRAVDQSALAPWSLFALHLNQGTRRDWDALRRAVERQPGEPRFRAQLAMRLSADAHMGFARNVEANRSEARQLAVDCAVSHNWMVLNDVGAAFGALRDFDRSIAIARRALEIAPSGDRSSAVWQLCFRLRFVGEVDEVEALMAWLDRHNNAAMNLTMPNDRTEIYLLRGDIHRALQEARDAVTNNNNPTQPFIPLLVLANVAATVGEMDEARAAVTQVSSLLPRFDLRAAIASFKWSWQKPEHQALLTDGLARLLDEELQSPSH